MIAYDTLFQLEKSVWTHDDFDQMGWHDSHIHGLAFDTENFKILFDIDYIYTWVQPAPGKENFSFWVSPCTLVFENPHSLKIALDGDGWWSAIDVLDIHRRELPSVPTGQTEWEWLISCDTGEISFRSTGYRQFTRKQPQRITGQWFTLTERGGVNFDQAVVLLD